MGLWWELVESIRLQRKWWEEINLAYLRLVLFSTMKNQIYTYTSYWTCRSQLAVMNRKRSVWQAGTTETIDKGSRFNFLSKRWMAVVNVWGECLNPWRCHQVILQGSTETLRAQSINVKFSKHTMYDQSIYISSMISMLNNLFEASLCWLGNWKLEPVSLCLE